MTGWGEGRGRGPGLPGAGWGWESHTTGTPGLPRSREGAPATARAHSATSGDRQTTDKIWFVLGAFVQNELTQSKRGSS